jgi:glycosyltransferase involved in cell wall biosynthesis
MNLAEQARLLKKSGLFHSTWYRSTYPDVAEIGMDPVLHYLKYGARMLRNPAKNFDTCFYLETYPDVAAHGVNPLLHYVMYGVNEGRFREAREMLRRAQVTIRSHARRLTTLGFETRPVEELRALIDAGNNPAYTAMAARELILWHMRRKTDEDYRAALALMDMARSHADDQRQMARGVVLECLCHHFLGQTAEGIAAFNRAETAGHVSPDLLLARVNFETDAAGRLAFVNRALDLSGVPPVLFRDAAGENLPLYDLLAARDAPPPVPADEGPRVSVLVASYNAADTLPTTLRSLQAQSWQNLEILVIDDCSTDATRAVAQDFADADSRIRVIAMARNGGAYVARNAGLDAATGDFVTIHDADDWSHPAKIETQMRFMQDNPGVVGCTSQQARALSDMTFTRWSGGGVFIFTNTSSFLFRRAPMREACGYWDTVRFAGDNELIRRLQTVFGEDAVRHLPTGPLSFQRDSNSSIVAHEFFGINGAPSGVRQEYLEAQQFHHRHASSLRYSNDPATRPFPAPLSMHSDRPAEDAAPRHFDVIIASDFRMVGGSTLSNVQEIEAQTARGLRTGLFQMYRYDFDTKPDRVMLDKVREHIDGTRVQVLTFGERATCDLLLLRYPPILAHRQRYIPQIEAGAIKVIVNQPPMSDYSETGIERYNLADCAANIRHYFGKDAVWHPIGPLVREALHAHHAADLPHIDLAASDWSNIIDIEGWDRGPRRRGPGDRLRIGRHSRDAAVKWPATRSDLLAAYPAADDVEVHVLGGARTAAEIIGGMPVNWVVHEFGALHPRDFLADIDVFVYFAHPDWVESFGRTIIEAMAVGVPVILPEIYRPLFDEAAIYATPETALPEARRLHADPAAYAAQTDRARRYIAAHFSYDMHMARLRAAGVKTT